MLAINHALTGASIGLSVSNPLVAAPLAFASHFALDAFPHYDPPGSDTQRLRSTRFQKQLIIDALLCMTLILVLALSRPKDWLAAGLCAFVATSPDLFWIPKFLRARKGRIDTSRNVFLRFHSFIQWHTSPSLWPMEAIWGIIITFALFWLAT